jgi:hypothetical protein
MAPKPEYIVGDLSEATARVLAAIEDRQRSHS